MLSQHVSPKYSQAILRHFGVYTLTDEALCLTNALLDPLVIGTAAKLKVGEPLDLKLAKKAIVSLFPANFAREVMIHANRGLDNEGTNTNNMLADPVLANPNCLASKTKAPTNDQTSSKRDSGGSHHAPNPSKVNPEKYVEEENESSASPPFSPEELLEFLRERMTIYSSMGGKLFNRELKSSKLKASQFSAAQVQIINGLAIYINEAMEFTARYLLRAATLEAQRALTLTITDTHLVAAGNSDPTFAMLFALSSNEDYFKLLRLTQDGKLSPTANSLDNRSSTISSQDSPFPVQSANTNITPPTSSSRLNTLAHKLRTAFNSGLNKVTRSSSPSPPQSRSSSPPPPGVHRYPFSPYPLGKSSFEQRCDYEDYEGVDLISQPEPPAFVVLENSESPMNSPDSSFLPKSDRPPDFETLFASGKTVKLFLGRSARNM